MQYVPRGRPAPQLKVLLKGMMRHLIVKFILKNSVTRLANRTVQPNTYTPSKQEIIVPRYQTGATDLGWLQYIA